VRSANQEKVYNYLKRKKRMISGRIISRQTGVPLSVIPTLEEVDGIGSFGPAGVKAVPRHRLMWYAKSNLFFASIGNIWKWKGRLYMTTTRPLREGVRTVPRRKSPINKKE
jgi:hypothetical protein